jgi:hypothetical protein
LLTTDDGASDHPIADGKVLNTVAYSGNPPRHLMPYEDGCSYRCEGMGRVLRDVDRTSDVFVKIGAADATPGDLYLKLSRRWFWRVGHILNPNILLPVPDRSFHALLHSAL